MDEVAGDIYANERKYPAAERIGCRFRDNCYALNSNPGDCPSGSMTSKLFSLERAARYFAIF